MSKKDQQSAVILPTQHSSCVPGHNGRLYPSADATIAQCPTNLDIQTPQGKALVMAAGNPGDMEFDKDGVVRIAATHWLIFPEQREDPETGEVGTFARTVLFDKDGRTFRTTAAHAPHRIQAALSLYSDEDWAQGVRFVIRQRLGKQQRVYHDIRVEV